MPLLSGNGFQLQEQLLNFPVIRMTFQVTPALFGGHQAVPAPLRGDRKTGQFFQRGTIIRRLLKRAAQKSDPFLVPPLPESRHAETAESLGIVGIHMEHVAERQRRIVEQLRQHENNPQTGICPH